MEKNRTEKKNETEFCRLFICLLRFLCIAIVWTKKERKEKNGPSTSFIFNKRNISIRLGLPFIFRLSFSCGGSACELKHLFLLGIKFYYLKDYLFYATWKTKKWLREWERESCSFYINANVLRFCLYQPTKWKWKKKPNNNSTKRKSTMKTSFRLIQIEKQRACKFHNFQKWFFFCLFWLKSRVCVCMWFGVNGWHASAWKDNNNQMKIKVTHVL